MAKRKPKSKRHGTKSKASKKTNKSRPVNKGRKAVKKTSKKHSKKKGSINVKKVSRKNRIDITFKNVRSIGNKKQLLKDYSGKSIKNAFKGRPPKGVIVVIEGTKRVVTDGKVKRVKASSGHVSPPDFVVNETNVKAYVEGIIEKMETDFEEWANMYADQDDYDGLDGEEDAEYGAFEPDSISGVSIKYF